MIKSILVAECGSTTTTVILIEQLEGEYRLRAAGQTPTTYVPPWEDITIGVQEAIRHLEKVVGRSLLAPGGWPITPQTAQQGVDAFAVISSAGPPLQLVIAGLIEDISLTSAKRAAFTTYTHVTQSISLDHRDNTSISNPEALIQAIQTGQPEVVLLVGGTDGGARQPVIEMAQMISMALQLLRGSELPTVLYAGNNQLRTEMADILGPVARLNSVRNVRPVLDIEDLTATQMELENLYLQKKVTKLPGFEKLTNWTKYPVLPVSKSFEKLISYLGQYNQMNVLGANIGSYSTTISIQARGQRPYSTTRSDAGVGHSLALLLKTVPIEKIRRWLPFEISPEELHNHLLNKSLYPTTIPTTDQELFIEQAVAREALRLNTKQALHNKPDIQWNLIVGTGRTLTGSPQAAHAALIMIDGLEPWGVTSLKLDRNSMVNMLGAIAAIEPGAAVQAIISEDAFLNLGTVVAPVGYGASGKPAVKVKLDYGNGEIYEKEIAYGTIELIDLPPGKRATLEVRPTRFFDIGLGQPGRGAITEVEGGLLGLIVDARGRPLRLPKDDVEREELLQQWLSNLNISYATSEDYD